MPSLRDAILKLANEAILKFEVELANTDHTLNETPEDWNVQRTYVLALWILYKITHDPKTVIRGAVVMGDFANDFRDFVLPVLQQISNEAKEIAGPEEVRNARNPEKKTRSKRKKKKKKVRRIRRGRDDN